MQRGKTNAVVLLLALGGVAGCSGDPLGIPEGDGGGGVVQPQGLPVCLPPVYAQDPRVDHLGTVEIAASVLGKLPQRPNAGQAVWALFKYYPTPPTCEIGARVGDCAYVACTPPPLRQAELTESLGTLTVTPPDGTSFDVTPHSDGSYEYDRSANVRSLFAPGQHTSIRAAGRDGQPGFAVDLTGPSQPSELSLESQSWVTRKTDLELSWKAPADAVGYAHFVINSIERHDSVVCDFPMSRTTGKVPAELLQRMEGGWTQAMFYGVCASAAEAGTYHVAVSMREHSDVGMLAVEVR